MSSHKEAPAISFDSAADNTDVYAFVSPDHPDHVTLIANFVPFETPGGGPNFFEFGDDVLYQIHVDNNGDGRPDISFQFRFHTEYHLPNSFLYNIGPIESIDSANWNRRQFGTVARVDHHTGKRTVLGRHLALPPCNVGPYSTPDYPTWLNRRSIPSAEAGGSSADSAPRGSTSTSVPSSTSSSCAPSRTCTWPACRRHLASMV